MWSSSFPLLKDGLGDISCPPLLTPPGSPCHPQHSLQTVEPVQWVPWESPFDFWPRPGTPTWLTEEQPQSLACFMPLDYTCWFLTLPLSLNSALHRKGAMLHPSVTLFLPHPPQPFLDSVPCQFFQCECQLSQLLFSCPNSEMGCDHFYWASHNFIMLILGHDNPYWTQSWFFFLKKNHILMLSNFYFQRASSALEVKQWF